MLDTAKQPLPGVALFSRRHIDLHRVAGCLCPGVPRVGPKQRGTVGSARAAS